MFWWQVSETENSKSELKGKRRLLIVRGAGAGARGHCPPFPLGDNTGLGLLATNTVRLKPGGEGGGSSAPAGERGRRAVETEKARLSEEEEECGENKKEEEEEEEEEEEGPQQCSHGVVARGTSGRL